MAMKEQFLFYIRFARKIRVKGFEVEQIISVPFFDPTTRVRGVAHLKLCRLRERLVCRAARIRRETTRVRNRM